MIIAITISHTGQRFQITGKELLTIPQKVIFILFYPNKKSLKKRLFVIIIKDN